MKLLRAICECGFRTRKARVGYHFHQWWFPVLETSSGQMTDLLRSLPEDQVDLIQLGKVRAEELHQPFIESATRELSAYYADLPHSAFNPNVGSRFACPTCRRHDALRIDHMPVTALCKSDCGNEYPWHDSEQHGCPKCNHRPHHFKVDADVKLARQDRTESFCPCSSRMDSLSPIDAYCPKCGRLPNSYRTNGQSFCGIHHERLLPYRAPGNFLFIETSSRWVWDRFPNAKLWGDASPADDAPAASSYCPACESDHQRWLATA